MVVPTTPFVPGGMEDRRLRCLYVGDPSMTEYTLFEAYLWVLVGYAPPERFAVGNCIIVLKFCDELISGIAL